MGLWIGVTDTVARSKVYLALNDAIDSVGAL